MKLLAEISAKTLGLGEGEILGGKYDLRKSARAVLLNAEGEMAVQHLKNYTFHKLPGGGIDEGESPEAAAIREVREEVGCECEIVRALGVVIEYRNDLLHMSYGYLARVKGEIGAPQLEEGEIEEGQETLWLTPREALQKMITDEPKKYEGYFILKRETSFLEEYLKTEMV